MLNERASLGRRGEHLAVEWLTGRGYAIRERNVRLPPWGEIDIVAEREGLLVLVEVRTRRGDAFGGALGSLSAAKRRRMLNAALAYSVLLGDDPPPLRVDLIGVQLDRVGRLLTIEHRANVVEGDESL